MNRELDQCHLVGEEFAMLDPSKVQRKQIFDKEVPTNVGLMEHVFDKCFQSIGINEKIESPLVVTEALCTPRSVRNQMAELIFECYDIPALSFAVDSLAGFYGGVHD